MSNRIRYEQGTILKQYNNPISMELELAMLTKLRSYGLVPTVCQIGKNEIWMERIQGETVREKLEKYDKDLVSKKEIWVVFQKLIQWLEGYHKSVKQEFGTTMVLTDFHFSNFICSTDKIWGIDFECYEEGEAEENYVALMAWLSLYYFRNPNTSKELQEMVTEQLSDRITNFDLFKKKVNQYIDARETIRELFGKIRDTQCIILSNHDEKELEKAQYDTRHFNHQIHLEQDVLPILKKQNNIYYYFIYDMENGRLTEDIIEQLFAQFEDCMDGIALKKGKHSFYSGIYHYKILEQLQGISKKDVNTIETIMGNFHVKYIEMEGLFL